MLAASVRRFPLAVLAATAFAVIQILSIHKLVHLPYANEVLYSCFASFFALLTAELVAEAKGWAFAKRLGSCLVIAAAVAGWGMMAGEIGLPHWLFGFALFGFCIAAPAFGGASNDELWQFNQQTFLGLAIAGFATGLFVMGAGAILYALSTLFGFVSNGEWFFTCVVLACALFWPLYTITFIPRLPQQLTVAPMMPGPLAFVLTFVALPVLLVFGALIAFYGVQVLGLKVTPITSVSWMVMGFSACGIALHFLLYPMRASGNVLVRWFEQYFFLILIPMLGLLFWAVLVRVDSYGVSENRYLALLGGFWALAIALSAAFLRGEVRLGNAPAALALMLVLASVGPWSAENISYTSQTQRLERVLGELGLLRGDAIVEPAHKPAASWQQRRTLSSLLDYFRTRRDTRMPDYLRRYENIDLMNSNSWPDAVMRQWQMRYVDSWRRGRDETSEQPEFVSFYADEAMFSGQQNSPVDVSEYSWLLPFSSVPQQLSGEAIKVYEQLHLVVAIRDGKLLFTLADTETPVDVIAILPMPPDELSNQLHKPMIVHDIVLGEATKVRLLITRLDIRREDEQWVLQSVAGYLLIGS